MAKLLTFQLSNGGNEVAFYFDVEDNTIYHVTDIANYGAGGGVRNKGQVEREADVLHSFWDEFKKIPNGQGHSHPGLGTFWSPTDLIDQWKRFQNGSPTMYFLVYDQADILVRTVTENGRMDQYPLWNGLETRVEKGLYHNYLIETEKAIEGERQNWRGSWDRWYRKYNRKNSKRNGR